MGKIQEFLKKYYEQARQNEKETGVPHLITLAQSALESDWGNKAPGLNFFGIKAGKSWTGKTQPIYTTEYVNGKKIKITDQFRAYDTALESFKDHAGLLKKRFPLAFKYEDPIDFISSVQNEHKYKYATDPDYVGKIREMIKTINKNLGVVMKDETTGPEIHEDDVKAKDPQPIKIDVLDVKKLKLSQKVNAIMKADILGIDELDDFASLFYEVMEELEKRNEGQSLSIIGIVTQLGLPLFEAINGVSTAWAQAMDLTDDEILLQLVPIGDKYQLGDNAPKYKQVFKVVLFALQTVSTFTE